jgi:hypothetical protein
VFTKDCVDGMQSNCRDHDLSLVGQRGEWHLVGNSRIVLVLSKEVRVYEREVAKTIHCM